MQIRVRGEAEVADVDDVVRGLLERSQEEHFEHAADIGLSAVADTRAELFEAMGEALTAEEYAEEAREAEASPLFASDEPLVIRLRTDIDWSRDKN